MSLEGQRLGEFEILERLGQGGMGAVYKARQASLRRTVALKTLQAALAADAEYITRFQNEAIAAAALMHPNLVQVFSAGENDGLHWFAMEYVEGESAQARVKRKERLDPAEAVAIGIHIATALEYGWRKAQLIHRDIKPDNIFLSSDGEVKLGDLGLAKSAGQTQGLTMTGASMGTPHYISPEQGEGKKDVDLRADIYSLGCTIFHLVAGKPPYGGETAMAVMLKHVTAPIPNPQHVWPGFPAELARVVVKMMAKSPSARQQTYAEVLADLRRAQDALTTATVPEVVAVAHQKKPPVPPRPKPKAAPAVDPSGPTMILPSPDAQSAPQSAAPTSKFKPALIAVVVAILGIIAWFAFGKKEPQLTEAERAEKARSSPALQRAEPSATDGRPDGLKPPTTLPAAEMWQRKWNRPEEHDAQSPFIVEDGWVVRKPGFKQGTRNLAVQWRDCAIRTEMKWNHGGQNGSIQLRVTGDLRYILRRTSSALELGFGSVKEDAAVLKAYPVSEPKEGDTFSIELRAVGRTLTAKLDGREVIRVEDDHLSEGGASIYIFPQSAMRNIEVLNLDRPATTASKSLSVSATKDAPFVNTLGMKFVPVPIGGGATKGERVLFGVWDVRVQDYAAYAAANPQADGSWKTVNWNGVPVGREPDHPVVGVSWEDAQAFCQWLTAKETAEGKLLQGMKYRLPSDEEWSWAVGLPPELGATPAEKSGKNRVDFPWGNDWPPTKKVGNYPDETFHAKFPKDTKDKTKDQPWIVGYDDGYATTSPVGSFPANAYGLYDMGGNVWQWCEDWFDKNQNDRVVRGAALHVSDRPSLLSSYRYHVVPGSRFSAYGFRCVLAPATSTPAATATAPKVGGTPTTATKDAPFVNTIGMKFVPVPGTKALFSIWETRVRDYAAFAKTNKVGDAWTKQEKDGVPIGREPEHPVCCVLWDEAKGFCQWLTETEIAAGKLRAGARYRLPTDEEWSRAVGLAPEQGATPREKAGMNSVDFPWGQDFPPKTKVGNFADMTFHEKFGNGQVSSYKWIEGYTDGFATTSPVGSFPANAFGLFDLSGNVNECCEDFVDASKTGHAVRGGSWMDTSRGNFLSAMRTSTNPAYSWANYGFRCVLVPSAGPAQAPSTSSGQAPAAPAAEAAYVGTWRIGNSNNTATFKADHTGIKATNSGEKLDGTWTITGDGDFHVKWDGGPSWKGRLSEDGQTMTSAIRENGKWTRLNP